VTKFPDLFAALAASFENHEVKIRPAQGGRQLHYITARTAMNRLDSVLGPENWWDEYVPSQNSVLCKLTIRLPDGSTITKADAGGYAGMADQGDDDKSGFSDSFKRAAAKFGVARYLYRDGVPQFVREREPGVETIPAVSPAPAENNNGNGHGHPQAQAQAPSSAAPSRPREGNVPRTGKALFAWTKDMEQRHEVGLLKYLNGWAKLQEFPSRMIDWDGEQVSLAYQEAIRKIQSIQPSRSEAYEEALAN
jgi:hypothetical protein